MWRLEDDPEGGRGDGEVILQCLISGDAGARWKGRGSRGDELYLGFMKLCRKLKDSHVCFALNYIPCTRPRFFSSHKRCFYQGFLNYIFFSFHCELM